MMSTGKLFVAAYAASLLLLFVYMHNHNFHMDFGHHLTLSQEHEHRREQHLEIPKIIHQTWKSKAWQPDTYCLD